VGGGRRGCSHAEELSKLYEEPRIRSTCSPPSASHSSHPFLRSGNVWYVKTPTKHKASRSQALNFFVGTSSRNGIEDGYDMD
jgi:hypothetical protein